MLALNIPYMALLMLPLSLLSPSCSPTAACMPRAR